jgi:hypothetical protein
MSTVWGRVIAELLKTKALLEGTTKLHNDGARASYHPYILFRVALPHPHSITQEAELRH